MFCCRFNGCIFGGIVVRGVRWWWSIGVCVGGCWENNRGGVIEEWWLSFERFFCWGYFEIGSDFVLMKGDGEDFWVCNFLLLGSVSSSRSGNERDG